MLDAHPQDRGRQCGKLDVSENHPTTVALELILDNLPLKDIGSPVVFIITKTFFSSSKADCRLLDSGVRGFYLPPQLVWR